MNKIGTVIGGVANNPSHRMPTLWELAQEYPRHVMRVIVNSEQPSKSVAEVKVPYGGDTLRLLRSISGAYWSPDGKVWRVPARSTRRLAEVLYVIASRSA